MEAFAITEGGKSIDGRATLTTAVKNVDADDDLIRRADFSLASACPMNGLLNEVAQIRMQIPQWLSFQSQSTSHFHSVICIRYAGSVYFRDASRLC
jgi:hypothetical protein